LRTLRNRCRTWLTRAAVLVVLCNFGIAGAQMADMQGLDNAPPPAFLSGNSEEWASPVAARSGASTYPLELSVLGAGSIYDGYRSERLIGSEDEGDSLTRIFDYELNNVVILTPKNAAQSVTGTFIRDAPTDKFHKLSVEWTGLGAIHIAGSIDEPALSCVTVNRDCSKLYREGTHVTLFVTPDNGWTFVGWSGACSGALYRCSITMNQAKSVAVRFSNDPIDVAPEMKLRKVGTGWGSIINHSDYLGNCGSHVFCSYPFGVTGPFKLEAVASEGNIFTGWRSGTCKGSNNPICEVYIDGNTIEAQFDREPQHSSSCQARHFSIIEEQVQDAYIAFYGRPADIGGLDYWSNKLMAAGGDLGLIMDEFGNSNEYRDRFGHMNKRQLVNNLYMQLFARPGDDEGRNWYVDELDKGNFTPASIALNLANGAQEGSDDWKVFEARRKVARHYITIMEARQGGRTDVGLALYLASAHENNADAICDALTKVVFP